MNPESQPLFWEMGILGLLSTDSQAGREIPGRVETDIPLFLELWKDRSLTEARQLYEEKIHAEGKRAYYHGTQVREKAYLCGFIHHSIARLFLYHMNETDCIAYAPLVTNEAANIYNCIPVTSQVANNVDLPSNWPPRSVPFSTYTPLCLSTVQLEHEFKHGIIREQYQHFLTTWNLPRAPLDQFVYVVCVDPKIGRDASAHLFHLILMMLHKVNRFKYMAQ